MTWIENVVKWELKSDNSKVRETPEVFWSCSRLRGHT
jgi:hypothetical protein